MGICDLLDLSVQTELNRLCWRHPEIVQRVKMMQEGAPVAGFEVPSSPDSSYNNPIPGAEEEHADAPPIPPHLHHTPLNDTARPDVPGNRPLAQNVILNHLYIQKRDRPSSVVALGMTQRYHDKYVTTVLYKPA